MIADIRKLIISHNNIEDGVQINCDIDEYVSKIYNKATILPYYSESKLKGFIAYYSNDISKKNAYLTMIIVDRVSQGVGIGKFLLESSMSDLKNRGFNYYKLEVLKKNEKAFLLYQKYGFIIEEDRGDLWLMSLNFN